MAFLRIPHASKIDTRHRDNDMVIIGSNDKPGNAIKQTDAKSKHTFVSFDSRNRRKSTTDRISEATNFTYTALGQLASFTDAESQTASCT